MTVPEAAVNENDRPVLREHEIGLSRQVAAMEPEPESPAVQHRPNYPFGFGVPSPDSGHHPAPDLGGHGVCGHRSTRNGRFGKRDLGLPDGQRDPVFPGEELHDVGFHELGHRTDCRHHHGVAELAVRLRVGYRDPEFLFSGLLEPHQACAFPRCQSSRSFSVLPDQDLRTVLYYQVLQDTLEKYPVAGNLVATGQLQLFCAHPWLQGSGSTDDMEDADIDSSADIPLVTPKIERTTAILMEAFRTGKKVLIFAIFNRCGDIVRQAAAGQLPDAFWGAINGSTPQQERQAIVDAFMAYDGPGCLVLNPKAAGTGLNITAATIVIHFTQVWNPALEIQASARARRRGQTEPVYIYRLFYEDTVERVMIDRSEWRRKLGNEAAPVSTRDHEDLKRALSLKPEKEDR